ncbi:MAG: ferritin-like domain-containing protein [Myxococcaceae bacterium]|nr:ferritin-like domain-containing protein [Myxococcaceae bacterium]
MKAPLPPPLPATSPLGRAFRERRVAPLPPPGTYPDALRARLCEAWRGRLALEYRSSALFMQLGPQLVEAHAPLEVTTVMLEMAQDELRHADGCREVLAALGDTSAVEVERSVTPLATHRGVSAEERALRNVIYTTCCSELVACARFVATLERTTDPFFHAAITRLLEDERLHGQFGFQYLAMVTPWLERDAEVRERLGQYLRLGFAVLERELAPAHPRPLDDEARAVGLECPVEARELFYATLEDAVVPALEAVGLRAEQAWKHRALAEVTT